MPSGITPTIVKGTPEMRIVRPNTAVSPANRRRHSPWPMTTTGCSPAMRASSSRRTRPRSGRIESTRKYAGATTSPSTGSGSPSVRVSVEQLIPRIRPALSLYPAALRVPRYVEHREAIYFRKRRRAQQHGVHDAEHHRVGSDGQRQRHDDGDGERTAQRAKERSHVA